MTAETKKQRTGREEWKLTMPEKVSYFLGRIGIYGEQALIPSMMNTFLIFMVFI